MASVTGVQNLLLHQALELFITTFYFYRDGLNPNQTINAVALLKLAQKSHPELVTRGLKLLLSSKPAFSKTSFLDNLQTKSLSSFPKNSIKIFTNCIIASFRDFTTNPSESLAFQSLDLICQLLSDFDILYEALDPGFYLFLHIFNQTKLYLTTEIKWKMETLPNTFKYLSIIASKNLEKTKFDLPALQDLIGHLVDNHLKTSLQADVFVILSSVTVRDVWIFP